MTLVLLENLPWNPLSPLGDLALYEVVRSAWTTGERHYHDLVHLDEMLRHCAAVDAEIGWKMPEEVFLATLFHDAVYEPMAPDNEQRSGELSHRTIDEERCLASIDRARVVFLIEATARHGSGDTGTGDADLDAFLDADMAILGAPAERYDAYASGVRKEFASVPGELFARGRASFLAKVLAMPSVFATAFFRDRFEAAARANIARELTALQSPPSIL